MTKSMIQEISAFMFARSRRIETSVMGSMSKTGCISLPTIVSMPLLNLWLTCTMMMMLIRECLVSVMGFVITS